MSWFSVDKLTQGLNSEAFQGLKDKVKNAVPKLDQEMLQKLTLTTPQLTAERQRIDEEERRKERVRDMLAGMMPWETRDRERDILVEECKDAVLKLSHDKASFVGPYLMPKVNVKLDDDDEKEKTQMEEGGEEVDEAKVSKDEPSKEQLEKLKTLSPLPPLLDDFDLDAHVGLIQRLLKADSNLVEMQSTLSGGGERERVFWRNYFFNCAWCRYEAGLSIDEIWSDHPSESSSTIKPESNAEEGSYSEHEICFDKNDDESSTAEKAVTIPEVPISLNKESDKKDTTSIAGKPDIRDNSDFEFVSSADEDINVELSAETPVDYELDELEAEIARELEN